MLRPKSLSEYQFYKLTLIYCEYSQEDIQWHHFYPKYSEGYFAIRWRC